MVKNPRKGKTYWLAGTSVFSENHVTPVTIDAIKQGDQDANDVVHGINNVTDVPVAFRVPIRRDEDFIGSYFEVEHLYVTRREATEALIMRLAHAEGKLQVAKTTAIAQLILAVQE